MSALRLLAVRPAGLLVVGRLVGRLPVRFTCGRVGAVRRCRRPGRPAFFVFLVFFNICLWCGSDAANFFNEKNCFFDEKKSFFFVARIVFFCTFVAGNKVLTYQF